MSKLWFYPPNLGSNKTIARSHHSSCYSSSLLLLFSVVVWSNLEWELLSADWSSSPSSPLLIALLPAFEAAFAVTAANPVTGFDEVRHGAPPCRLGLEWADGVGDGGTWLLLQQYTSTRLQEIVFFFSLDTNSQAAGKSTGCTWLILHVGENCSTSRRIFYACFCLFARCSGQWFSHQIFKL